jgi:hypothetical protein
MDTLIPRRDDVPHTTVLWVRFEVHEKFTSGELRGSPVVKGERVFTVDGADRFICERRLNELLQGLSRGG